MQELVFIWLDSRLFSFRLASVPSRLQISKDKKHKRYPLGTKMNKAPQPGLRLILCLPGYHEDCRMDKKLGSVSLMRIVKRHALAHWTENLLSENVELAIAW